VGEKFLISRVDEVLMRIAILGGRAAIYKEASWLGLKGREGMVEKDRRVRQSVFKYSVGDRNSFPRKRLGWTGVFGLKTRAKETRIDKKCKV